MGIEMAWIVVLSDGAEYYYEKMYGSHSCISAWDEAVARYGGNVMVIIPGSNAPYSPTMRE
jgi:hypothetical protein|tara:strand:- start:166 stop:348 length:183 start_codon:yes stop_codon:yes gene_type:complete